MKKVILHIDFDSFFASVAQQDNPILRGKPIGVTATNGRNAIIAASREAKKLGIKSPSRTYDAQKICPTIQFVPANFVRYWDVSKKFIDICKNFSPYVEVFSLDEVFMDITGAIHLFGNVDNLVYELKNRIEQALGRYITASVGISHNKLLAKLASGMDKPNGYVTIRPEDIIPVYKRVALTDICGIGSRIEKRLLKIGIHNLLELRHATLAFLIAEFGNVEGRFLKNVGLGIDNSYVLPYTTHIPVKSVGRNYCLPQNEYRQRVVVSNFYELCEEVAIKLRRLRMKARTVGFSLRGNVNFGGRKTFGDYFDTGRDIFYHCLSLLPTFSKDSPCTRTVLANIHLLDSTEYIRQISVWASGLTDEATVPLSLFDPHHTKAKLTSAVDAINEKFGDHTIRNGFLLYADKLTTVPNGFGPDTYEKSILEKTEFPDESLTYNALI